MEKQLQEEQSEEITPAKRLPPNVIWLSIASLFNDISGEIVGRGLPMFLATVLGTSYGIIGLIEGAADTISSFLKIISGWYSDRWGKRKIIATIGYSLTAVSRPILYFATSWVMPFFGRLLDRTGKGIRTSPRDALIADSVHPTIRGRAFGFHRALDPLGAVIGALIAALYLEYNGVKVNGAVTITAEGWKSLVIIATIPTIISCLILFFLVKEAKREIKEPPPLGNMLRLGSDSRFNRLLVVLFLFTLGASSDAFLILRAGSLGVSPSSVFIIIALLNVVTVVSSYPAGVLSDTLSRKTIIRIGWITYALIYTGFAFATEEWHIWMLYTIYGLYYGLTEGVEKAFVADLVPASNRGSAFGAYNGVIGLGTLPASLIAGVLWEKFGPQVPFLFGAVMALVASLLLISIKEGKHRS